MTATTTAATPSEQNGQYTDPALIAGAEKKAPASVELRSAHDFALVTTALKARKDDLEKLSKKASDEGYYREAKTIQADAEAIEFAILPQFAQQTTLPLLTQEQLEERIHAALRVHCFRAFEGLEENDGDIPPAAVRQRRDELAKTLSAKVAQTVIDVAEAAWKQGYSFRHATPERIASEQLDALRAS